MNRPSSRTPAFALVPIVLLLCVLSCTVPLAPGYQILQESREVDFVPGPTPALRVQGRFKLENMGNGDLSFIDLTLPPEQVFGRRNLRVELDGREIAPVSVPREYRSDRPNAVRLLLDPAWQRKGRLLLSIGYDLAEPSDPDSRITLGPDDFHLSARGWFPVLLPPKHVMSAFPERPKITRYTVRVPSNFLVLARGTAKGRKRKNGETEYHFELISTDLPPFIVAGRYIEWPKEPERGWATFWTLHPLASDPKEAAAEIGQAWSVLVKDFGPLDRNIATPHVVESPELRAAEPGPAAMAFPGGVLVNPATLALGTGNSQFLEIVIHTLARDWFGDQMYPAADAEIGLGEGLPEYATIVVDAARNGPDARIGRIRAYLSEYDEARTTAPEKPLGITTLSDSPAERRIALAKAPLFFVALEDACGQQSMWNGLKNMVDLLRGREASYDSLRSALEEASGKNLASLFRVWLNDKGIPQDFRDRYE